MPNINSRLSITSVLLATLTFVGCGSSGGGDSSSGPTAAITYSGVSVATAINAANAEDLTTTSGEAVRQGADASSSRVFGIVITDNSDDIETLSVSLASAMASMSSPNLPAGFDMNGSCGGRVTIPDEQLNAFNATSGPVSFTMTFTRYCDLSVGAQYTIDGQVVFNYEDIADNNSGFSLQYNGVTINDGSGPVTINMTVDCSNQSTCTIVSDFVGNDGGIYRISDISFTGDATTGFNGSATFFHPGYGSVSITASSVTYGSCGNFPDGGSIMASGTTGTAQIVFNSNCTYIIDYDDGSGDTGVINGSFL
jgi:hypothetical protein